MGFKNLCVRVLWTKVASSLEGLIVGNTRACIKPKDFQLMQIWWTTVFLKIVYILYIYIFIFNLIGALLTVLLSPLVSYHNNLSVLLSSY